MTTPDIKLAKLVHTILASPTAPGGLALTSSTVDWYNRVGKPMMVQFDRIERARSLLSAMPLSDIQAIQEYIRKGMPFPGAGQAQSQPVQADLCRVFGKQEGTERQ
jgi:hypothetical protein